MDDHYKIPDSNDLHYGKQDKTDEIRALNEKLTLTNEELKITNEELKTYRNQLEEIVSIRTLELRKKEESLKYKNRLEKLMGGLSSTFFNLTPELIDDSIVNALRDICTFIHADLAYLSEIIYSENAYSLTHLWQNDKLIFDPQYFKKGPLSDHDWWLDKIHEQDFFIVNSTADLPENTYIQNAFHNSKAAFIAFFPIKYQGNLVGFTGFVSVQPNRTLNSDELPLLRHVGEVFVNALKRKEAELILIENERNYREIFNATSEAIIIYDYNNDKVIDVNQAATKLFGFTYEEALTGSFLDFSNIAPDFSRETAMQHLQKVLQNGAVVFEWQTQRKNGELFWTEVSLKNTIIGGDLRTVAVIRDISERKNTQQIILQSEVRFRSIVQFLTDIIWIVDEETRINYSSPSSAKVLGYSHGTLIGKSGLEIIHPEDLPLVLKELNEVLAKQNDHLPTEFRAKHKDGQWVTLEVIADNMLDHPAINGIIITGRDVTERRRVEKALKISESKFRNIFNNSSDAIAIIGLNYSFLEVNEVFLGATGYSLEETKKMKLTEIITDAYLPQLVAKLPKIFRNEHQQALQCEIIGKSKSIFPVEINSKLIEFEGERALILVIRDITERKHLESKILDTIISTEEREREKFARNLHDELGPLLSSIKMYVNSLSSATEKSKHDFILTQLKKILTEVIQSTKEISNDLSPHVLANYGLLAALEWFINQLGPCISITLESNIKDDRYPSSMELSIYRIIKELINNTIKHAQASAITIRLHLVLKSIHLYYSDNGMGFTENWQQKYEFMGMGMSNIISRCRSINASNKFHNNAHHGMSFEMEVPVDDNCA